jgi:pilus assembly protein Flp/PilA
MLDLLKINFLDLLARFRRDEDGAALVEYGLLVGLIAVICIVSVTLLGTQVSQAFQKITDALTTAGLTG